jgi:hypothetical protein
MPRARTKSACLPLVEGYSTSFRNFDVQTQKVKLLQLTVAGKEEIKVPAGTFDTLRIEIASADGGSDKRTLWIAKETHKVVKVTAVMGSMGGAVLTQELVQSSRCEMTSVSSALAKSRPVHSMSVMAMYHQSINERNFVEAAA